MRHAQWFAAMMLLLLPRGLAADEAMTPEGTVSTTECRAYRPQAAHNSLRDEYLVVWHDECAEEPTSRRIWARRLDRYGRPLEVPFAVSPGGDPRRREHAGVAYDRAGDRYLVVYALDYYGDGSDWDVVGRYLAWDGVVPGWTEWSVAASSLLEWQPDVTYSRVSESFLVAWSRDHPTLGSEVVGALFAFGGSLNSFVFPAGNYRGSPDVAFDASTNRFTAVSDSVWDVYARVVDAATGDIGTERLLSGEAENENLAAVASCGNGQSLVTWQWLYGSNDRDLLARFTFGDATADGAVFPIENSTGNEQNGEVSCLDGGLEYLIVWQQDWYPWPSGISGRRVSAGKVARPGFSVRIPDTGENPYSGRPGVAGGLAGWLVAWEHEQQEPTTHQQIRVRVVWELFADGFEWGDTGAWSSATR